MLLDAGQGVGHGDLRPARVAAELGRTEQQLEIHQVVDDHGIAVRAEVPRTDGADARIEAAAERNGRGV